MFEFMLLMIFGVIFAAELMQSPLYCLQCLPTDIRLSKQSDINV